MSDLDDFNGLVVTHLDAMISGTFRVSNKATEDLNYLIVGNPALLSDLRRFLSDDSWRGYWAASLILMHSDDKQSCKQARKCLKRLEKRFEDIRFQSFCMFMLESSDDQLHQAKCAWELKYRKKRPSIPS